TAANASNAIVAQKFVTFSLSCDEGYALSLGLVSRFDYRHSPKGPGSGLLQFQVGRGLFIDVTNLNYAVGNNDKGSTGPINLSRFPELQNVPAKTNITFRIVNFGATDPG